LPVPSSSRSPSQPSFATTPVPVLRTDFFARSVHDVAPDLIGATLLVDGIGGRIVEAEAYDHEDPARPGYRGRTERNASMVRYLRRGLRPAGRPTRRWLPFVRAGSATSRSPSRAGVHPPSTSGEAAPAEPSPARTAGRRPSARSRGAPSAARASPSGRSRAFP